LRLTNRKLGDLSIRGHDEPSPLAQLANLTLGAPVVELSTSLRLLTEDEILRDGERRHEHEVLMHHADTGIDRGVGVPASDVAAFDLDPSAVGLEHPR
jgi:hypothetical protein